MPEPSMGAYEIDTCSLSWSSTISTNVNFEPLERMAAILPETATVRDWTCGFLMTVLAFYFFRL
jgi:hypothetical protein